jgi:hypothetical protein
MAVPDFGQAWLAQISLAHVLLSFRPLVYTLPSIMTKYILVSGGVVSGIGKGVIGANVFRCRLRSVVQKI